METRKIGSLDVSIIGLGTNNFGSRMEEAEVLAVVDTALEAGINFFDTADSYGKSEPRLAQALGARREGVVVATKFASALGPDRPGGARPQYIRSAAERSLRELATDHIDLYQIHRPDPDTPIADTLAALDELVRAGTVREIGCSNFSAEQLVAADEAVRNGAAGFVSVQNHCNLLHRADEAEVLPTCERLGLAHIPYFPLASGLLTGKYRRGEPPRVGTRLAGWGRRGDAMLSEHNFDLVDSLTAWAGARGHSLLELAFAWLLAKPAVASVIAGATKPGQVVANAAVTWTLSPEEVAEVDAITAGGAPAARGGAH
jgi:aryl-alcohol dehydrogenase-like predicted oxidoreductase